jgi:putative membrane protein
MNPFQQQFPLSPKKFWKKFLPTIIPILIVSLILGGVSALFPLFQTSGSLAGQMSQMISLFIGVSVVLAILLFAANIWYFKAYIRNYFYDGGDNFITIKKKVFTPQEIHIQYPKIQDVYVDQDLLDRVMGLYDVHIASATAASGIEAHIDGVDATVAEGLKNFFLQKIQSPTAPIVPGQTPMPAQGQPVLQFTEEVSNKTYPIQSTWMTKSIIGMIFSSLVFSSFVAGYLYFRTSTDGGSTVPFLPVFIVLLIGFFIVHLIGLFIWRANYRFQFMPEYIQFHTGILSQSERHLPYRSIQDVSITQSFLDRLFGLSNVTIENAAQMSAPVSIYRRRNSKNSNNIILVGQSKESANKIVELLKPVILSTNSSQTGL